jgi:hypothetical protein
MSTEIDLKHTKCLSDKIVCFYAPLKKQNWKTFANTKQVKTVTSTQSKLVEVKAACNVFGQLIMLSEENDIWRLWSLHITDLTSTDKDRKYNIPDWMYGGDFLTIDMIVFLRNGLKIITLGNRTWGVSTMLERRHMPPR